MIKRLIRMTFVLIIMLLMVGWGSLTQSNPSINLIVWSHSDQFLATSFDNGLIEVRDAISGQIKQQLDGHSMRITSLDWSTDDSLIVSGAMDGTVRIWNADSGQNVKTIDLGLTIFSVIMSFDNTTILAAYGDEYVMTSVFSVDTGQHLQDITTGSITYMAHSPDETLLAVAQIYSIEIFDTTTLDKTRSLNLNTPLKEGDNLIRIAWHPSGEYIAAGALNGAIYVWNIQTLDVVQALVGDDFSSAPESIIKGLQFDATGNYLLTFSGIGYIRVWNWEDEQIENQEIILEPTWGVDWNSDGSIFAYAPRDMSEPVLLSMLPSTACMSHCVTGFTRVDEVSAGG